MSKPKTRDIRCSSSPIHCPRPSWTHGLYPSEMEVAQKAARRAGTKGIPRDLSSAYVHCGNFTVALLIDGSGRLFCGVSKRNPIDRDDPKVGETIALSRAVRQL